VVTVFRNERPIAVSQRNGGNIERLAG
jgi:hypothetical protein